MFDTRARGLEKKAMSTVCPPTNPRRPASLWFGAAAVLPLMLWAVTIRAAEPARTYANRLVPLRDPKPLLADYPQWIEPIRETNRFEAPYLVDDRDANLEVRAWRFSYNARGIIEMPNRLRAAATAVIMVHPWGIDDGQ
ncbi:MAG TPA: hypothetical protein VNM37_05255, partial [Candidatus Dormibacteraeota bacterium]|nr:hypothetical protein [Candidatus Dormibacteraeota bacterium]